MAELLVKWRRASAALQEKLGRTPEEEEIARSLKLGKKKLTIVRKAIRIQNAVPQGDDPDSGRPLDELLTDGRAKAPDEGAAEADDLRQVTGLLLQLDERSAAVLRLRFGLDGEGAKTLKEIGERLGLTRERVRQIESEALDRLREGIEAA
jgi:RNA polymerase primary sigma factor